jgi:hypothetical protein
VRVTSSSPVGSLSLLDAGRCASSRRSERDEHGQAQEGPQPGEDRLDPVELAVDGTSSVAHFETTQPDQWHIDGRRLTRDELRAIHDMQPPDLIGYHLIQDQVTTGCSDHGRPSVRRTFAPPDPGPRTAGCLAPGRPRGHAGMTAACDARRGPGRAFAGGRRLVGRAGQHPHGRRARPVRPGTGCRLLRRTPRGRDSRTVDVPRTSEKPAPKRSHADKWAVNIAAAAQLREREGHLTVLGKHIEVLTARRSRHVHRRHPC